MLIVEIATWVLVGVLVGAFRVRAARGRKLSEADEAVIAAGAIAGLSGGAVGRSLSSMAGFADGYSIIALCAAGVAAFLVVGFRRRNG